MRTEEEIEQKLTEVKGLLKEAEDRKKKYAMTPHLAGYQVALEWVLGK